MLQLFEMKNHEVLKIIENLSPAKKKYEEKKAKKLNYNSFYDYVLYKLETPKVSMVLNKHTVLKQHSVSLAKEKEPPQEKLNNLFRYYQKGQLKDAERLATFITKEFPKHQFGWKVLGSVLKKNGQVSESLFAHQKSVELVPEDAQAHYNLGNTLQQLGRLEDSEVSYRQAIILNPDDPLAYNNLGTTLIDLGRFEEAKATYTKVTELSPDDAQPHYNLGITFQELGRLEAAEASYKKAIALNPNYYEAHNNLLKCLYILDKNSLFFNELDYLIKQGRANAVIGSLTSRSALKFGIKRPNIFCNDPLKYVLHSNLNINCDFNKIFVENAKSILNEKRVSNRKQSLLVNGCQTSGNLFDIENTFTKKIEKTIRLEIDKYLTIFKNSEEGLIKKWPTEYSIYAWLISMKSGGEIQPHIHDEGWLSGSIYINIPPKSDANSGDLVVSLGEKKDTVDKPLNTKKIINVITGSLVLFPASLTHYTIPFESQEERIVLAFDVKQK